MSPSIMKIHNIHRVVNTSDGSILLHQIEDSNDAFTKNKLTLKKYNKMNEEYLPIQVLINYDPLSDIFRIPVIRQIVLYFQVAQDCVAMKLN